MTIIRDKHGNEFESECCIMPPPDKPPFDRESDWTVFDSAVIWIGSEALAVARDLLMLSNVVQIAPGLIKMTSREPAEYRFPADTFRIWKLTGRYDQERDAYEAAWPD